MDAKRRAQAQELADNLQIPLYIRGDQIMQHIPIDDPDGWEMIRHDPAHGPKPFYGFEKSTAPSDLSG